MQLGYRFSHVMRRMLPIAMHLLAKDGEGLTGHELFLKRLGASFHNFVEEAEAATRARSAGPPSRHTHHLTHSPASLKSRTTQCWTG